MVEHTEHAPAIPYLVGCSGLPPGLRRERYFEKLPLLECPETFVDAPKDKILKRWRADAPGGSAFVVVADQAITHPGDDPSLAAGHFRKSAAVDEGFRRTVHHTGLLSPAAVLFRTPPSFSPGSHSRAQLTTFFREVATAEALGNATRVWEPSGLWEIDQAVAAAAEAGVVVATDPLADMPGAPKADEYLPPDLGYLRISGLGRRKQNFSDFELEELAALVEQFERCFVVFTNDNRNKDAVKLRALLS